MEILRAIKNNKPISNNLALGLLSSLQIQILVLFLINHELPIYSKVFNFISTSSPIYGSVSLNLVLNLVQIIFIIFKLIVSYRRKNPKLNSQKSSIFRLLQIKPYLLFVQIININSLGLRHAQPFIIAASSFNLLIALLQIFLLKTINISYRFVQKNFVRRKNNSIIHWILIIPTVFIINYYSELYGAIFLSIRGLIQMYYNFHNLQGQQLRNLQWFYPLLSLQLAFIIALQQYMSVSIFNHLVLLTFVIFLTIYCSKHISDVLSLQILKYHIKKSTHILDNQSRSQSLGNQPMIQINPAQLQKILLQLRIMVKIYDSKLKYNTFHQNQLSTPDNFDSWWNFWDRFMLEHKVYCSTVDCMCQRFIARNKGNQLIEQRIFADKIYDLIKKIQKQTIGTGTKLKIVQNYFLIEMEKKPLKTYYQLIKLFSGTLNRQEALEVENLILETRDNFKEFSIKERLENTDLNVEPLFEFQQIMKGMRTELNGMALQYKKFYEFFGSNFVQMETLKKKTRLLTKYKEKFNQEIEYCLKKFQKSIELMVFCMVYYQFFDEYNNKLERIQTKAQHLYENFTSSRYQLKRQAVQIFHPGYGAVKADLVFNPGQIISISKNVCHALGFTHRQIDGQKVNKLMPHLFGRVHDKILRNFVQKGAVKMLKHKQNVLYSRAANKFIVPITVRLKVDYSSPKGMCAIAFLRPTPTKSEYILMNNYGKVEQMSEGIYKKLFEKAFYEDAGKTKRLYVSKMLLSLNYYLKETSQTDESIHQGLFLTSQDEQVMMSYFKQPDIGITNKKMQNSIPSSKSMKTTKSFQNSGSGTISASIDMDFSDDMSNYTLDMKESLKDYLKKLDMNKVVGRKVCYKVQDINTSEFKCKVLQVTSIRDEITGFQLRNMLRSEILDVAEHFGLEEIDYQQYKNTEDQQFINSGTQIKLTTRKTNVLSDHQNDFSEENIEQKQNAELLGYNNERGDSDASSVISTNQVVKKKQTVISAFEKKTTISLALQYGLTFLILFMALILIVICVFSIQLEGNYQKLQHDNLMIMNFRIDFLLRLGIHQLEGLYRNYNMTAPAYLEEKKQIVEEKMKAYLLRSIKWIDFNISWKGYQDKMLIKYADQNYTQNRSIYFFMTQFYAYWSASEQLTRYFTDNYVILANYLVALGNKDEILIMGQSVANRSKIHIVIIIYGSILLLVFVVSAFLLKIAYQKENKIIDFLPFLKSNLANQKAIFYEKFFEYNKQSENIELHRIKQLTQEEQPLEIRQAKGSKAQNEFMNDAHSKFIRVAKNQKGVISRRVILAALAVFVLCLFVIFFAEYFFGEAHKKFDIYLKLKNSAMLVQLVPSRIIMLYFININKLLTNQTLITFPTSYSGLAHDRLFELQSNTGNMAYHGSEMQKIITEHFTKYICELVACPDDVNQGLAKHQLVFYLSYRYINSFNYIRSIIQKLPLQKDPKATVKKWMDENNVWQIMKANEFILDLIKKDEQEITDLFSDQISQIGFILFSLSLTQIPILIVVLLFTKKKYVQYVSEKLQCSENIYKHISWNMLSQNTYAINYFEDKLKKSKTY